MLDVRTVDRKLQILRPGPACFVDHDSEVRSLYAGSGIHTKCNVGLAAVTIPNPCLLSSPSAMMLLCKVHLTEATFTLSSGTSSQAHLTGRLTSFASQIPLTSQSASSRVLVRASIKAAQSAAVGQIADRRQDHISGHWSHPALLDCSLHLAASLAEPAGILHFHRDACNLHVKGFICHCYLLQASMAPSSLVKKIKKHF